jgi:hypothetical protein
VGDGFLRSTKVRSTTSFEVNPLVTCHKVSRLLKIPAGMKEILVGKMYGYFSTVSLLGVCAAICHKAMVDKSGIIRTQMGKHYSSETGRSAWDALYDTTP